MQPDAIKLPDFAGSGCFYFEACGKLLGGPKKPRERKERIARVRLKDRTAYFRLIQGSDTVPSGHLHVDLAVTRVFKLSRPKVNSNRAAISNEISRYFGQKLDVRVFGQFGIRTQDIPPASGVVFAGPNVVVSTVNNTVVEVGGAHLIFRKEGFVHTIDWQIYQNDTVFVDIYARCEIEASPSYLDHLFVRLSGACKTYILGGPS